MTPPQMTEAQLREALAGLSPAEQDQMLSELEKSATTMPDFAGVKSGVSTTAPHSLTDEEEADLRMESGLPQSGEGEQDTADMAKFVGKTLAWQAAGLGAGRVVSAAAPYATAAVGETLKRLPIVNSVVKGAAFALDKFKKEREARKVLEAMNRIGPTAEGAAATEASLASGTAPASARQIIRSEAGPPSVSRMNRPMLAQSPAAIEAEAAATSPIEAPPPPVAKPQPSRLGTPQTGMVQRTQTVDQAATVGKQAKAAIEAAKARLASGESPKDIVQSFIDMGVRTDVAKELVKAAGAGALLVGFDERRKESERNRKAQKALADQAKGVVQ